MTKPEQQKEGIAAPRFSYEIHYGWSGLHGSAEFSIRCRGGDQEKLRLLSIAVNKMLVAHAEGDAS